MQFFKIHSGQTDSKFSFKNSYQQTINMSENNKKIILLNFSIFILPLHVCNVC